LYALTTALARITRERPIQLDSITILRDVGSLPRLAEHTHRRILPWHRFEVGKPTRSRQRIGDGCL